MFLQVHRNRDELPTLEYAIVTGILSGNIQLKINSSETKIYSCKCIEGNVAVGQRVEISSSLVNKEMTTVIKPA